MSKENKLTPLKALFNKFLEYVDTPTRMHLMTFGDVKGFKEYRILRTLIKTALKKQDQDQEKLKALDAIKETLKIEEADFFYDEELNKYFFIGSEVSKEKFDLLKEVLL